MIIHVILFLGLTTSVRYATIIGKKGHFLYLCNIALFNYC